MSEKYSIALKQTIYKIGEMEAYAEVRYKASLYSVSTVINMEKPKQVVMEIHLDKWVELFIHSRVILNVFWFFRYRDVHIILSGINQLLLKEAGVEIKWDANRDPGQRFAANIRFQHPQTLEYLADVLVSYPGRKLVGSALFSVQGNWKPLLNDSGLLLFLSQLFHIPKSEFLDFFWHFILFDNVIFFPVT